MQQRIGEGAATAQQRPVDPNGNQGTLSNLWGNVSKFLTSPDVTNQLKQQGENLAHAGDIVGTAGTGLTVGGVVTWQPEIASVGVAGMAVGDALIAVGNGAVVLSDVLSNNRNSAVKDAVSAGVGTVLPYGVDPHPAVDSTIKYFGY